MNAPQKRIRLALGPLLYYWERDRVMAFYEEAAARPDIDVVYLGEVVCSKRRDVRTRDWLALAETLASAGKQVVLSTLALVEAESELATLRRLAENGRYLVEANDMAVVGLLSGRAPFVIGPHVNVYNAQALGRLVRDGAQRCVLPIELPRAALADLLADRPPGLEIELFVSGRMPLAFSARCFTARAHRRGKDECDFVCRRYPDGLPLYAQDGRPFLVLNGIQVQSAGSLNLAGAISELRTLDVDIVRTSPQSQATWEITALWRSALDGAISGTEAAAEISARLIGASCDGYFHGGAGMDWRGES